MLATFAPIRHMLWASCCVCGSIIAAQFLCSATPLMCRVTTHEDLSAREVHGADVGSLVAYKWWSQVDHVATKDGKMRK
jgi:hypothetical protein